MKSSVYFYLSILLVLTSSARGIRNADEPGSIVTCEYYEVVKASGEKHEQINDDIERYCVFPDGRMLRIINLEKFISMKHMNNLKSGRSRLKTKNPIIENSTLTVTTKDGLRVENKATISNVATASGEKSVLGIRVIANDESTTSSMSEISDEMFGTISDPHNMKSQYAACSHNQFTVNPFSGTTSTGQTITDGVGEVTIDSNVKGVDYLGIQNDVTEAAEAKYGDLTQFDHVLLCLPKGTINGGSDTWVAYGLLNHYLSVYNDEWYVQNFDHSLRNLSNILTIHNRA